MAQTPAAAASHGTFCDLCHRTIATCEPYHRVTLGMNEEQPPNPYDSVRTTVEEVSELVICAACEPKVSKQVDSLLAELWEMRAPEPGALDPSACAIPPEGWECSRGAGHEGPCAASPAELSTLAATVPESPELIPETERCT